MNNQTKIKLVHKLMETHSIDGICGYLINEEEGENNNFIAIYLIFDEDQIREGLIDSVQINRKRNTLKSKIENMFGFYVYVGSISKKCDNLNESVKNTPIKNYIITETSLKRLLDNLNIKIK